MALCSALFIVFSGSLILSIFKTQFHIFVYLFGVGVDVLYYFTFFLLNSYNNNKQIVLFSPFHSFRYDSKVNPGIIDSFASAAFRFGHSLLPTAVERWSKSHKFICKFINYFNISPFLSKSNKNYNLNLTNTATNNNKNSL